MYLHIICITQKPASSFQDKIGMLLVDLQNRLWFEFQVNVAATNRGLLPILRRYQYSPPLKCFWPCLNIASDWYL